MLIDMKPTVGCVLSIGNFDGVHLGHQKLVKQVAQRASSMGLKPIIMTLDPHPIKVLFPEKNMKNILELGDRVGLLQSMGVSDVQVLQFSREVSTLEPEEFFKKYVIDQFQSKHLVVGYDFNFGKNRHGTIEVAKKLCEQFSIGFTVVEALKINDVVVSSSKIRKFIDDGDVESANQFLGRSFYISGMVEKGAGRGKKIGFPTANLFTKNELIPLSGVYVTLTERQGQMLKSVTNVGYNPTFGDFKNTTPKIETHFLEFNKDIYGEKIKVHFLHRLRDEMKFHSVEDLVAQIANDVKQAKGFKW